MATALRLTANACPSVIQPMRELVAGVAREYGISERRVREMKICLHEALANVVCHAYQGQPGPVDVRVERHGNALTVLVTDEGGGSPSDIGRSNGMGLRLMSHLADGCTICASGKGMQVEMMFRVKSNGAPPQDPVLVDLVRPFPRP